MSETVSSLDHSNSQALVSSGPNPIGQVRLERVRFSAKERKRILEALTLLRGPGCEECGELDRLEIHHAGGLGDNRLQSLHLLCKSCHLTARAIPSDGLVSVSVPNAAENDDAIAINRKKEQPWVEWVKRQLAFGAVNKDILTGNSAHEIGLSVATINRYWQKHACPLGPFRIFRLREHSELLVDLRKAPDK